SPRPSFHTEANYVRADVYATRDGAPVDDLIQQDFEILEDRVPQKIDQFEHVIISSRTSQPAGRDPVTTADARQIVRDSRARVFVLFLDGNHVEGSASRTIRTTLGKMLDSLIGPDDLIALMMPGMSARDITFGRNTTLEGILANNWWGQRD